MEPASGSSFDVAVVVRSRAPDALVETRLNWFYFGTRPVVYTSGSSEDLRARG